MKIEFSADEKRKLSPGIQRYFQEEWDEEIGLLATDVFLDFVTAEIGPAIYNRALNDARTAIADSAAELEYRLYEMERLLPKK